MAAPVNPAIAGGPLRELLVVGFGRIAEILYAPALAGRDVALAVVEPDPERRAAARDALPEANLVTDLAIAPPAQRYLAGALNLTPGPAHAALTQRLLAQGWHVFSEKPAAGSVAQWRDLAGQAATADLALVSAPVTAFLPEVEAIVEQVSGGAIGQPCEAHTTFIGAGPARRGYIDQSRTWFFGPESSVIHDLGPYALSPLVRLFGAPTSFTWHRNAVRPAVPVRPSGSVVPAFGGAAIGVGRWGPIVCSVQVAYRPFANAVEARLDVVGTQGQLTCELDDPPALGRPGSRKAEIALELLQRAIADGQFRAWHTAQVATELDLICQAPDGT